MAKDNARKAPIMSYLYYVIVGIVIGFANVIPGVSGGTAMVVFGVYERIISIITDLKHKIKEELGFIIAVGLGMGIAVFVFGSLMHVMLTENEGLTRMFFIGVIVLSVPMIAKKALGADIKAWKLDLRAILPFVLVLACMILMATADVEALKAASVSGGAETATLSEPLAVDGATAAGGASSKAGVWTMVYMFIYGIIGCATMIIPGISGSLVMVMLGCYAEIMAAVHDLDLMRLIPFAIGALIGLIFVAKLIRYLLKRFPTQTYSAILGFVVGSVFAVFPGWTYVAPVLAFLLGGAAIVVCEWYGKKRGLA